KVWWKCKSNSNHYWESTVNSRTNPTNLTGCPFCANKTPPR
ncbi:MAG: zinc-ribbon domain-containing protein, partial [Rhodospirillaceae bacterium]|nr:zinc-ribbon domain-containing protein [Rhodospirillaceae bacterium]